jgi:hypothetical protein
MRKAAILTTVVLVTVLVGGVALATAGPEIDDVSGTWSLANGATTSGTCTGEDGVNYQTVTYVDTGAVSGTSADFGLSGAATFTNTVVVSLNTNQEIVSGPFTLIQDSKHRLKGKLQGVGEVLLGEVTGRGWMSGTEQKKTTTGWVNTPDHLWANVEYDIGATSETIMFGQSQGPDPLNDNIGLVAAETTQKTC